MLAAEQLLLLTKYSALTHCHLDLITLCLLQTRMPSFWAEISLVPILAGSTGISSEQVPPERSPGTHESPRNSIRLRPLTAGKDAAAKPLGQHSRLLRGSQAASTQRTRSQRSSAFPRSQPQAPLKGAFSKHSHPRPTAAGASSSRPSGRPAPLQGLLVAKGACRLIFLTCVSSPGVARGLVPSTAHP